MFLHRALPRAASCQCGSWPIAMACRNLTGRLRLVRVPAVTDAPYTYKPANLTVVSMADGRSEARWAPTAEWGNPVGNVHGGYTAVLVDDVAGMALMSVI